MVSTLRSAIAALSFAGIAALCSPAFADGNTAPGGDQPQVTPKPYPNGINCVWRPLLRSGYFTVLDDRHVVVEGDNRKYYLLTLTHGCFDIDTAFKLGITSHGEQLCGPGDSIVTRRDRCPIQYLEEVSSGADAKAIVAARDAAEKARRRN
jgi:Family of unknown function (DUF6491)